MNDMLVLKHISEKYQDKNGEVEALKDINLSIALKLADLFRSSGYTVVMTRETDISIGDQNIAFHHIRTSETDFR